MHADGDNNKLYYYIRAEQTKQIQSKIILYNHSEQQRAYTLVSSQTETENFLVVETILKSNSNTCK